MARITIILIGLSLGMVTLAAIVIAPATGGYRSAKAVVTTVYPDEGLFSLAGVNYTGFSDHGLNLTNAAPAYSYEAAEWTRVAEAGDAIVIAGEE